MVQIGAQLCGSGQPTMRPFSCQGGCLEEVANGVRCQLAGVARHVVKMPPTWRGSGCRDGKLAKDLAEFCGSCWAPGQFPDLLLDSTAPPPPSSSSPPTIILILDGASGWQRRSRCSG